MHRRTRTRQHTSSKASSSAAKKGKTRARGAAKNEPSAHAFWRGSIAFGLVQIPVRMVVAERTNDLSFHQLDGRDLSRIHYKRVNESSGEEVAWKDIVKAYETEKGKYVVLEDSDFEKANVEATQTIDIQDFVTRADIPPEYFERSYFLVPERSSKRAYAVLRDAIKKAERAAIALVVLRTRQHLAAIVAEGSALRLVLLHFHDELVPPSSIAEELPGKSEVSPKEEAMAEQLIKSLAGDWDPKKYKDTYKADLLRAIEQKAKTGHVKASRARTAHASTSDLLTLLERSIAKVGKPKKKAAA